MNAWARRCSLLTFGLSVITGLVWTLLNATHVPAYGDTQEYLHAALTLQVDQYRTILYPLTLRLLGVVRDGVGAPFTPWIYGVQWLMLCLSTALFVLAFTITLCPRWPRRRIWWVVTGSTLAVVSNPLISHFSLALMSDSLASSLSLAAISCVVIASLGIAKRSKLDATWLIIALLALLLLAISRVDKLYLAFAICLVAVLHSAMTYKAEKLPAGGKALLWHAGLYAGVLVAAWGLNRETQTVNHDRPPLDLSSLAFNRVVWPRLSETYPYLSPKAKAFISPGDAAHFDEHNNNVYPLLANLLKSDPSNRSVINEITLTTLRKFPAQVAGKTVWDITKYTFPNVAFPLELVHVIPQSIATDWTRSRMAQATPLATDVALYISQGTFLFIELPVALAILLRNRRPIGRPLVLCLVITVIATNSLLFGLEAGMDAHIRYSLPTYTLLQAIVATLFFDWLLFGQQRKSIANVVRHTQRPSEILKNRPC